jgi:RNA polymerase sigma-70 factor (ECF subfamily)
MLESELGPNEHLDDLTQDVFIRVLEGVGNVREPRALRAWLRTVAVFTARAHVRRAGRRRRLAVVSPEAVAEQRQEPPCLDARIALREVCTIIESMPVQEREVFMLRVLAGRKLSESAEACGVSLSTFKAWLTRAQRRFARQVSGRPSLVARLPSAFLASMLEEAARGAPRPAVTGQYSSG